MVAREKEAKLRTLQRPHGVIIPAFIHDGDRFPADLKHMQYFEIQQCFNVRMARNSPRAEELDAALEIQAKNIAACIENAPPWRKSWPKNASQSFFKKFYEKLPPVQQKPPTFTES